jgi:CHAT domain-containing protein/Flp pilus assembly protein TadD
MKGAEDQHPEVTDAYIQQAKLMRMMERFDEAQTAIQAAQKSALKLTGYDLYFSAEVYREDGEIAKALGKSKFALAQFEIAENILMNMPFKGKLPNRFMKRNQVALGIIQTRKAQTYIEIGKYYSTQKYLTEALDVFKAYQGEDFIPYAEALSAMAELSFHLGNYTEGERQSIRAKEIMAYVAGEFHPVYAKSLTTHAEILLALGRTEEAKTLMEQALEISRTRIGENNSLYIQQLSNLGYLDFQQGDLKNASIRLKEAIKLSEAAEIKNKQIPALNLIRLAMVLSEQKMYRAAEKNLTATFDLLNTFTIPNQKLLSQAWFAYGILCQDQMKWEESISHFQNAYDLFLQVRIESHPDVFTSQLHLAIAYWKIDKIEQANLVFRSSLEQIQAYIHKSFQGLSDQEKNRIWNRLQPYFNIYAQFTTEHSKQIPDAVQHLFADQLKTKSFLLSGVVLMKSRIMNSGDESAKKLFEKWADLNGQLAFLSRIEKNEMIAHGYNLDEITTEIEQTEKQLSQKSNWFQFIKTSGVYSADSFSQLLAPQEAAIEIIKLNAIPNLQLPERYVAIILRNSHKPELVIIGEGQELEHKYLTNYRRSIQERMNDPYSYHAYWNALAPFLQNIQKVYFSADGVFHLINPETFTNPQGQYLADVHQIIRVSNLQEVHAQDPLTNTRKSNATAKSAVILGNPDMYLDMNTLSRTTSLDAYPNLPGTGEEVEKLHRLFLEHKWKSTLFTGAAATEKALRSVNGPSVLHVATHGYFIESQSLAAGKHFLGMEGGFLTQHPMLRSGLLLSGSGSLLQGLRTHQKDTEDGLLSALEVMSMDLDQTELVVLSACESGLGTIVQGEGVMGLIRGFRIAGAQSVLMTLWKISDESTGNLMNMFYLHLLSGKSRNDALKAALSEFRSRYPNPQDWGAFVINGI